MSFSQPVLHSLPSTLQLRQPKSQALLERRYEYLKHKYQGGSETTTVPAEAIQEKAYRTTNQQGLVRLTVMGIPNLEATDDAGQTKQPLRGVVKKQKIKAPQRVSHFLNAVENNSRTAGAYNYLGKSRLDTTNASVETTKLSPAQRESRESAGFQDFVKMEKLRQKAQTAFETKNKTKAEAVTQRLSRALPEGSLPQLKGLPLVPPFQSPQITQLKGALTQDEKDQLANIIRQEMFTSRDIQLKQLDINPQKSDQMYKLIHIDANFDDQNNTKRNILPSSFKSHHTIESMKKQNKTVSQEIKNLIGLGNSSRSSIDKTTGLHSTSIADMLDRNIINTKNDLKAHLVTQMNPVIRKNMESVNHTMNTDFEKGSKAKSTQGVPIETFMRMISIENARKEQMDKHKSWIRRNKHVIKLQSIMNRNIRDSSPTEESESDTFKTVVQERRPTLGVKGNQPQQSQSDEFNIWGKGIDTFQTENTK